jgi:hypothetical protein
MSPLDPRLPAVLETNYRNNNIYVARSHCLFNIAHEQIKESSPRKLDDPKRNADYRNNAARGVLHPRVVVRPIIYLRRGKFTSVLRPSIAARPRCIDELFLIPAFRQCIRVV